MKKNMVLNIIYLIIGSLLIGLACFEKLDSFWSGMGFSLFVIGAIRLIKYYRLSRNEAYKEKMEIELNDERNHFIRNKAWAWTGYLFVLISAAFAIVFRIFHQNEWSIASGLCTGILLTIYCIAYCVLKKKY